MPSRVIALVYTHDGDGRYHTKADNATKALLRQVNRAITEHHGHRVGTCWGDARGRDAAGGVVLGYALCMDTPADKVPWVLETFWGGGADAYQEQIPGVGYINRGAGRAPMYDLDVSLGNDGVQAFLAEHFDIEWTPPPAPSSSKRVDDGKEGRLSAEVDADDPFLAMEIDDLRALCAEADVGFAAEDSKAMLRNLYLQAIAQ